MDAEAVKVQHALLYIRNILAADGHFRAGMRELLQPERDVARHVGIRAAPVALIDAVQVVLPLRAVNGDADGKMFVVLRDEPLHLVRVIVDAVGGKRETVGVEPMMVPAEHLRLQVIAYLVYQVYLKERLAANEVPNHARLAHVAFVVEDVINRLLRHLPRHPLFRVFPHKVAVFAGKLAVLRHDERDVFRHAGLPAFVALLNSFCHILNG